MMFAGGSESFVWVLADAVLVHGIGRKIYSAVESREKILRLNGAYFFSSLPEYNQTLPQVVLELQAGCHA